MSEPAGSGTVRARATLLAAIVLPFALLHACAVRGIVCGGADGSSLGSGGPADYVSGR